MLVTLHTMLPTPNDKMKQVTQEIIRLASTVVVLTENSKIITEQLYDCQGKVFVVPHGIHPTAKSSTKEYKTKLELSDHLVLTTFGLLGPGKGIEYVLRSLPAVVKKYPNVLYLVLGETHPVIRRKEGEQYRTSLSKIVTELKLEKHVKFFDQYLSLKDLLEFLKATDVYIATSTDPHQAVSGTLSYALGAGKAVISTDFIQAKEMVTADIGRLVPMKDSPALTAALLELLSDPARLKRMGTAAFASTRKMLWSNVAAEYIYLLTRTAVPPLKIDHLSTMTDQFGLFQFASFSEPNKKFGYTLDDNARALILCSWLSRSEPTQDVEKLLNIYLHFIETCQRTDGSFTNYLDFKDRADTTQNKKEDLEDAQSRAMWALSEVLANQSLPVEVREKAKTIFLLALPTAFSLTHIRARAFTIKAFATSVFYLPDQKDELLSYIHANARVLVKALHDHSYESWVWFEDHLLYNNGVLPESLLIAGSITGNEDYTASGLLSLQFLISKTFSPKMYRPIGHSEWYKNNETRSEYDQQPEDPASMILALSQAYKNTGDVSFNNLAKICFSWFLGNNTLQLPLYDEKTGGCYDGLHPDRVNLNQGAESLVSYLMSSYLVKGL